MSNPAADSPSTDGTPAAQLTKPLRELVAFVLLGANAVFLLAGLIQLLIPRGAYSTATSRAGDAFFAFVGTEAVLLPVLAVLLATHVRPVLPKAKLITQVALGEYAAAALLGGLTFLIWTVGRLAEAELLDVLLGLLLRGGCLAIFAVAAYVVWTVWRTLYYVPKPKPQPGLYGQPQPGWPQQSAGYPAAGQPGAWPVSGQFGPSHGQPTPPFAGAPQPAPPFGQPSAPSFPPGAPGAPPAPPFGQPPSADATQTIPRQSVEPTQGIPRSTENDADRTQRFHPGDHPDQPR